MIKLLIGGSPCTFWSIAQKNGRETKQQTNGQAIQAAYERIKPLAVAMAGLMPAIRNIINVAKNISNRIMHEYPNKRVVHLAYHGKKARTRKKNIRRIQKWLQIGGKNDCI